MDLKRLQDQLRIDEGRPANTYFDSKGILTGGIGRNLIAHSEPGYDRIGIPVSDAVCDRWFKSDIDGVIRDMNRFIPWWSGMDVVRQNALGNLMFNMGWGNGREGLSTFTQTLKAFAVRDFDRAAEGFKYSRYAKDVGPERSGRICYMISTGLWPGETMPDFGDVQGGVVE